MEDASYGVSNKWLTVIRIDPNTSPVKPLDIMEKLEKENIESRPVWKPMHLQPVFARCNFYAKEDGMDVSKMLFEQGVCMPSGTQMTEEEQDRVIEIVKGLWK
jgi:pyridoxal phosphate-dependent aminotransferase EpsN